MQYKQSLYLPWISTNGYKDIINIINIYYNNNYILDIMNINTLYAIGSKTQKRQRQIQSYERVRRHIIMYVINLINSENGRKFCKISTINVKSGSVSESSLLE